MKRASPRRGFMIEPEEIFLDSINSLGFDRNRHEGRIEKSIHPSSGFWIFLCSFAVLAILGWRVGVLQLWQGGSFYAKALEQSLVVSTANPPRGQIIDVHGILLAGNETSFDLVLYKSEFLKSGLELSEFWKRVESILGLAAAEDDEVFPASVTELPKEFTVARNLDQKTLLIAEANKEKLPGLLVQERYRRVYTKGPAFSTVLGYTGLLTQAEQKAASKLSEGALMGKHGLERQYNELLRGNAGRKIIQVDARREVQRVKTVEEPRIGATLELSLDAGLQEKAYEVLGSYIRESGKRAGAVVAIDPRSGAVRVLVSYPSFQNNLFSSRLSRKDFEGIFMNADKPLFNRAVSGEYPPGSAIKPVIASAALEENIINPEKQIFSAGFIQVPNPFKPGQFSKFLDWKPLGWMDLRNALAFSSNVYFYSIGGGYDGQQGLGIDRIKKYESLFGLGKTLGIDFPNEGSGFIPDPLWKADTKKSDPIWRLGDTYNVSIGQGDTLVTPLQVAAYTAVFANGGTLYQPYLTAAVIDPETKQIIRKTEPTILRSDFIRQDTLATVREGMRMVVTIGTARMLQAVPVAVAGKTGTAETGRLGEAHAWFTAFAPYERPELAISILVEKGGEGSSISVPIAKEILSWYFGRGAATGTSISAGDN